MFACICAATFAAGRSVSFDVRDADKREVATIQRILGDAARIAALEDRSAVVSDTKSIAFYAGASVPISIAARESVGAVQIRVSWSPPENTVVSVEKTLKRFQEIVAFLEKELTTSFSSRVVRKVARTKGPNQPLENNALPDSGSIGPRPLSLASRSKGFLVRPRACLI